MTLLQQLSAEVQPSVVEIEEVDLPELQNHLELPMSFFVESYKIIINK